MKPRKDESERNPVRQQLSFTAKNLPVIVHDLNDSPRMSVQDANVNGRDSTQNRSPDKNRSLSPSTNSDLALAYARHRLIVSLMREVYAMFNSKWGPEIHTCTNSQAGYSSGQTNQSESQAESIRKNGKRRLEDRDSPPGDDNNIKRDKRDSNNPKAQDQGLPYACPFHKYAPQKYCMNNDTGAMYRSCAGPGFSFVSHVK